MKKNGKKYSKSDQKYLHELYLKQEEELRIERKRERNFELMCRPVAQLSNTGMPVTAWESIHEVGSTLPVDSTRVLECCLGERVIEWDHMWRFL